MINSGDTLQSIAQSLWGDANMWYVIADANGLDASSTLTIGDSLTIPNVVSSNRNDATTFKPYDPTDIIGDTTPSPASPPPPKPKKKKCGGVASVVMVVVAVVATIYTAGAASALFAGAGFTGSAGAFAAGSAALSAAASGTALTAGAIGYATVAGTLAGAAIGSAASQLTGMALGVQDKFSWSQVAVAGISGAATLGLSNAVAAGSLGESAQALMKSGTAGYAAQGVFNYSVNYAASKVVGLDTAFSWKNVAASAISSVIAGNLNTKTNLSGSIVRGIGRAASSAYIRDKWLGGGKPDYAQVAADAFGNALADYLMGTMGKSADEPDPFFQIGSGKLSKSFSYAGNSLDISTSNSASDLSIVDLGNYEPKTDYADGAYLAGLDTSSYLGQQSTDQNLYDPYENLIDRNATSIANRATAIPEDDYRQTLEPIEGSFLRGARKRFLSMFIGDAVYPTKTTYAEENSVAGALRNFIGADDTIQNQADLSEYENETIRGVRLGTLADITEGVISVAFAGKGIIEIAKAPRLIKLTGLELGELRQTGGRFTDFKFDSYDWDAADNAYDVIRSQDDIASIANNLGKPGFMIDRVKNHVFYNNHVMRDGTVRRFDSDPLIANAWNRFANGNHTNTDLLLFKHEYLESKLESIFKVDYTRAHQIISIRHPSGIE